MSTVVFSPPDLGRLRMTFPASNFRSSAMKFLLFST